MSVLIWRLRHQGTSSIADQYSRPKSLRRSGQSAVSRLSTNRAVHLAGKIVGETATSITLTSGKGIQRDRFANETSMSLSTPVSR